MDHKKVMEGVVTGVARGVKKAIVDGIVSGVPKHEAKAVKADVEKVAPSLTKVPKSAFGAGLTPDYKRGK